MYGLQDFSRKSLPVYQIYLDASSQDVVTFF